MTRVPSANLTVLLHFQSVRRLLFVLRRVVVSVLTLRTRQRYKLPHLLPLLLYNLGNNTCANRLAALTDGKAEFLFEGYRCH